MLVVSLERNSLSMDIHTTEIRRTVIFTAVILSLIVAWLLKSMPLFEAVQFVLAGQEGYLLLSVGVLWANTCAFFSIVLNV